MHAAEHRHQQRVAGVLPAQIVGVGAAQHQCEQRAGVADHAAQDDEGLELQAEGGVAETLHALLVVAQRLERATEWRVGDAPQQPHGAGHGEHGEDVEGPVADKPRTRDALQAVLATGEVGPFVGDLEGDLRKCQCEQREIQSASAQDDQRDGRGEQQRECYREHQRLGFVAEKATHRYRHGVAGAAEEHRGAEWDKAGVAD